jgi:predicted Zn-dependent protease
MKTGVVLIASVLALSACGGGGGRLSKADFQAKANAICSKYNAKIKRALANVSSDPHSLASAMDRALGYIKKGTKELDDLDPPKAYEAKYQELSRINHEEISTGQKLATAARASDKAAIQSAIAQLESQGKKSDRLATEMGLDSCASE